MKKIYLFILFLTGSVIGMAQDLDDIRKSIVLKQYSKAKEELEKFLAKPANAAKADGYYYKAFVYNAMSLDPNAAITQSAALNKEAFLALKKYKELDPSEKLTKEEENGTLFNVYYSYYDMAARAYNAKDYEQSYNQFTNVQHTHEYIFSNKYTGAKGLKFTSLDTDVVFNMIVLGNELKKPEAEMVSHYKKIVDAGLDQDKYLEAYEGMVMYYKKEKNAASFNEYLTKGKAKFPKDEFWEAIDIEFSTEGLEKDALFKKYDELLNKYPNSYVLAFNYGLELNKHVFSDDPKTGDIAALKARIPELFKKAIAIKSTVDANILTANFYYNSSFDLTEESKKIKGNKPDEVKKRLDLISQSKAMMSQSIPFAEEAIKLYAVMPKLKASDKINYRQAYDILVTAYSMAGNAAKSAEYEKKKAELN